MILSNAAPPDLIVTGHDAGLFRLRQGDGKRIAL
jgi:hypothetical protein